MKARHDLASRLRGGILLALAILAFVMSNQHGMREQRQERGPELAVRLPLVFQIVMAAGDRYLAANLAGFRILVAEVFRMGPEELQLQAQLQRDISWLNPAHQDNYYIAAAILSVPELIPAAQYILRRAADARPDDWQPLFYLGFNKYYFEKDAVAGAQVLLEALPRMSEETDSWTMQNLAARWIERGYSASEAARIVGGMADNASPGVFKRYLNIRVQRLRDLAALKALAERYRELHGRRLASLDQLVTAGLIERIPADPFKRGYALDEHGEPVFAGRR